MQLTLTRPTNGTKNPRSRVRLVNRHGTSLETRPLLCDLGHQQIWADPQVMPFRDGQFSHIVCLDLLAYVHDDQATINELARILKPGGKLLVRIPNEGLTAGLDAHNLYRYWADGTHRGGRPPETDELGWRRHFRDQEITAMLESAGLRLSEIRASATGISELVQLGAMLAFRWFQPSEERYQRLVPCLERIRELDNRIPVPWVGFTQTVIAVRQ